MSKRERDWEEPASLHGEGSWQGPGWLAPAVLPYLSYVNWRARREADEERDACQPPNRGGRR